MHAELPALTTDPISQGIVATALLALFVLLTMEKSHRVLVALGMVSAIWAISYLTPWKVLTLEAAQAAIDLNVLLLLAGMMAVVGVLKQTGAFEWGVARLLAGRVDQPVVMLSLLIWVTAIASAFLDNVTTVIFVVPITLGVARQLGVDPRGILLPVVMAANVGGTATLIGDPPNIMIGSAAPLAFTDFLISVAAPVLVMMVGLDLASRRRFRAHLRVHPPAPSALDVTIPAIRDRTLLVGMSIVSVAVLIGFLAHGFTGMPAAVPAIIGAAVGLAFQDWLYLRHHKPSAEERRHGILAVIEHEIEWPTLVFFALLFMLVGAAVGTGLIGTLAHGLESAILAGRDAFGLSPRATVIFAALLVMWVAGVMSGIIDNIPFVAVSIPIVATLTGALAEGSNVLWWALALGACLGGNLTPIGASANITTLDLAARQGTRITFREFVRVGIPTVALSLLTASIWVVLYVVLGNRLAAPLSLAAAALLWLGGRAAERITAPPSR